MWHTQRIMNTEFYLRERNKNLYHNLKFHKILFFYVYNSILFERTIVESWLVIGYSLINIKQFMVSNTLSQVLLG